MSIRVGRSLVIPDNEVSVSFEPSGGPGGQHANKAATRVVMRWNVRDSAVLGPRQRARLESKLASRIDSNGTLQVTSDRYRSQHRNREDATERLADMVRDALRREKRRVPTKPTAGAVERRLEDKRRRSEKKRARRAPDV
ncbi:MAG TPA: alternative ribosome rescue aminoacyl-tRNA hydrolase ArfB [Actinomycetota bacterium]|nr:alternative ribosome rescue aminoacyl-tRNA hydrolase ArfB [Actinomycetota bacterium]